MEVNAEDYFTYDARLASFTMAHKRRGSAKGKGMKAMKWPHAHLKADAVRYPPTGHTSQRNPPNQSPPPVQKGGQKRRVLC